MSFTNLFASLTDSGAKINDQPSFAVRGDIGKDQTSTRGKKRANRGEPPGHHTKRQCHWTQITDHEKKTKGVGDNCANKARYSGQTCQTNHSVNQQQQRKQTKRQKGRPQEQGQPQNRGGSHQTKSSWKPGGRTQPKKHMQNRIQNQSFKYFSPEFKEQNIVLVNEQLICRHFLLGRCIKGDRCQMQHIEVRNDLIKAHCKFYLQGICTKGQQCPFMHNSFPCKFFHKKAKCAKGEACRFSHEPLNDITLKLLNESMELEMELAKKTEQSSFQPVSVDEPEVTQVPNPSNISQQANTGSDELVQPFKFKFYNSAGPNVNDQEPCRAEEVEDVAKEDAQACDTACPLAPINLCPEPPVLYSVEAVLGIQSSGVFKTHLNQNPTSNSVPPDSSGCSVEANHCQVPYSVDVVLGASKSTELGHSPTTAAPMLEAISYTPTGEHRSASQNNKASDLLQTQNEASKVLRESWKKTKAFQIAQESRCDDTPAPTTTSKVTQAETSAEYRRQKRSLHCLGKEEKRHLTTDMTSSGDCALQLNSCKGGFQNLFSRPPPLISTPKHSPPSKSRQSHLTNDLYPLSRSPQRSTQFKESASVPAALVNASSETDACGKPNNHLPLQHPYAQNTKSALTSGPPQAYCSSGTTKQCKTDCPNLAEPGCSKTLRTPFTSLFASSVLDAQSSTTLSTPQHLTQAVSAKSTNVKCQDSSIKRISEPDGPHARSLCNLFATPLARLSPPCVPQTNHSYQPGDRAALLSDTTQSESPFPTLVPQAASSRENGTLVDPKQQENQENTHKEILTGNLAAHQQQLVTPPCVDSSSAVTSNSVLNTLFRSLGPYRQDRQ